VWVLALDFSFINQPLIKVNAHLCQKVLFRTQSAQGHVCALTANVETYWELIGKCKHTKHLTPSLLSTVLHSHLLPKRVDGYEVNGAHTWVNPCVSVHVD